MTVDYEIHWMTDTGSPLKVWRPDDFTSLQLAYGDLVIGGLQLIMPRGTLTPNDFALDQLLEVYRIVDGVKKLEGERSWRIRNPLFYEGNQQEMVQLTAYDHIYTLDNAIIAYYANSSFTAKSDYADDMMKEMVYENLGAGCKLYSNTATPDTARMLEGLTIQGDNTLAPSISKKFAWEKLKPNLDEICNDVRQRGHWLGYDMVRTARGTVEFRTYYGQRGNDYTGSNRKIVSTEFNNLINPMLSFNAENERNYAYVTGTGVENDRKIVEVSDANRINTSRWNRRETQVYAAYLGADTTTDYLTSQGNAELYERRPKTSLTGNIVESNNFRYGVNFDYGDKLIAQYIGYTFDVHVDKVNIRVQPDLEEFETLTIRINGELT
jgi:hypothetical protein